MSAIKSIQAFPFKQVKQPSSDEQRVKKYIRNNYTYASAVTLLSGAIGYGIAKEEFNNQKKDVVKNYNQYIDELMNKAIATRIKIDGHMSQEEINEVRGFKYQRNISKMNANIAKLQKKFKSIFLKNTIIGTLIGAAAGSLILLKTYSEVKKKNNSEFPNKLNPIILSDKTHPKTGNKISFGSRFFDNDFYSDEDEEIAEKISKYKLDRDWPAGLNGLNKLSYVDYQFLQLPKTDMEYHDILLSQEIPVPSKPPEYYRNYDKWFNTKRYKAMQNWPTYIEQSERYKKVRRLINYLRLENIKLEMKRAERETRVQMQSAFIKSKLFHNFISIVNQKNLNKKGLIPNAIMLEGTNRDENIKTIKWLISRSNAAHIDLDYNPNTYPDVSNFLAKIESALETAQENYKKTNGQRTILYINNFDLLIKKGMDTSDIKNMIQELSEEYKTTLIFETADSSKLEPVALQDHRFGLKFIIKEDIKPETLKELEHEFFNMNTIQISNGEGYRFNYLPGKTKYVDLFLGSFGYDKNTLWLEGNDFSDIVMGCNFIDSIKKLKMFKSVKKLQTKSSSDSQAEELSKNGFEPTFKYTIDKKMIWEKTIV